MTGRVHISPGREEQGHHRSVAPFSCDEEGGACVLRHSKPAGAERRWCEPRHLANSAGSMAKVRRGVLSLAVLSTRTFYNKMDILSSYLRGSWA
jgi:hypothetical protein